MRRSEDPTAAASLRPIRFAALPLLVIAVIVFAGWMVQAGGRFERETARLGEVLALEVGMTVADVGAGDGSYSAFLAEQVGETGRVFATEVTTDNIEDIAEAVADHPNVTVVLGRLDDTGLPHECCDRILLRNVYHHFLEPPDVMVASLFRSLKPGGVIAVVDFTPRGDIEAPSGTPDRGGHGTPTAALTEEMTRNGFEFLRRVRDWPGGERDYCLLFRRPS